MLTNSEQFKICRKEFTITLFVNHRVEPVSFTLCSTFIARVHSG